MKHIFLLSKENIELAKAEVLALTNYTKYDMVENLLILETDKKGLENRLAYTHRIYRFLFETNYKGLVEKMQCFDWQSVYNNNFCLRIEHLDATLCTNQPNRRKIASADTASFSEKELAGNVWRKLKKPKVNLTNPKTKIELFFSKNKVICGLLLSEISNDFNERKAHLRPGFSPVSLHPRLARALVNICGIKKGETLLDPFCGTGGILIEAGLMGIKAVGYDIDDEMLGKAKENIRFYNLKNIKLIKQDATKIAEKYDYIVTDFPYGKNTKKVDLLKLYKHFLLTLKKILRKKAVIVFPDFVNFKKLLKKFKIEQEFSYYIHRSLSKRIVVIKK
jgi:tRNA (guanine10-N2)-dimethyltransferase